MASPKEGGEEASSSVSSSDVAVAAADNDETEQLDNAHSDFLQHFENEIRISQPDSVSLTKGSGSAVVPDSTVVRSASQLQHTTDGNASGMIRTDDAADVLANTDPYAVSNFVGARTDMFVISPLLSSQIEG